MLNELLISMRQYASDRKEEVRKGICSAQFAASLIHSYSESMVRALKIIGRETDGETIKKEAVRLCLSVYPKFV